tara:strand:+ start:287 stop:760 length:474 start_codon:yes stop_codon:yes gene_type:complete
MHNSLTATKSDWPRFSLFAVFFEDAISFLVDSYGANSNGELFMTVTIYHNPRCSKSRLTLQLLKDRGIEPTVIEYLKTSPDAETLKNILDLLGLGPRDFMRTKEEAYAANGLADEGLDEGQLIAAMVDNPILIERPVVLANGRAAVGRPPENVEEIL